MAPSRIVVMGVSGSGKSTVAAELAARLGVPLIDADALHPVANVEKMAAGHPLSDGDRRPWLSAVRQAMRREPRAVVACSALKRSYRDALRSAGDVGFVDLVADRSVIDARVADRTGHFMGVGMVESQFEVLEEPGVDETDVVSVDAGGTPASVLAAAEAALATLRSGTATSPLLAAGGESAAISGRELAELVGGIAMTEVIDRGARRVLLVPPDHTRLHSRAGEITVLLHDALAGAGCTVAVLPATGTHAAMSAADIALLFAGRIPSGRILEHRWREAVVPVGEIHSDEISALSDGRMTEPIPVEVDEHLLDGWDLVVSIGQVVPHEVIGMANFTKNLVIGLGGAATIHRSHFLGAVCDLEKIMGRPQTPVRDVVDAAFDRFLARRIPVLWLLTVIEDTPRGVVQRGLYAGRGGSGDTGGAAYRAAAELSARSNIAVVPSPLERIACWLDPAEFRTTWLSNKAVYRTRMAVADGGELIVLAPGVSRFGEDSTIDALIRRHGFHGTAATLEALRSDPELAGNLGVAAHLIHGSSEGRFRIVYCTDPATGGLTAAEIEGAGYEWRPLPAELERLGVRPATATGPQVDRAGTPYSFIANPALGLWAASTRFP